MTNFYLMIELSSEICRLSNNQRKTKQAVPRSAARWLVQVNLFNRVLGWRKRKCKIARGGLQRSQRGVAK